ncbi:hypothetical protein BUE93_11290 [Chromobacterium amazonense]|uniref:Uncharacterized protein n=1 Tax=Chromobacterium amazonense TaxID=1382803 RepID=A0A2S9X547_9NEIS|nr:hypothetical protein [Chromobacterium amazonense]PRP70849.1 hypothetical protein BUE93_11290 [Chromobacterium amazonense]
MQDQDVIKTEVEIDDVTGETANSADNANQANSEPDISDVEIKLDGQEINLNSEDGDEGSESSQTEEVANEESSEASEGLKEALETAQELKESFESEGDKLAAVGLTLEEVHEEFIKGNGKISEKTLEKVKEAGYSEKLIKGYLRGVTAAANEVQRQFMDSFGGFKAFEEMTKWASTSGDPALVEAFNNAIDRDDLQTAVAIGKSLQREQKQSSIRKHGTKNAHLLGGGLSASTGGAKGFSSEAAMIKAINDPRYGNDRAYTEAVKSKVLAMTFN